MHFTECQEKPTIFAKKVVVSHRLFLHTGCVLLEFIPEPTWRALPPSLSTPCPWSHVRTSVNLQDGFHLNQMFNSLNDFLNEDGLHCMDLMLAHCHIH